MNKLKSLIFSIIFLLSLLFSKGLVNLDTDNDGYLDTDEITENTNPNDPFDKIYLGNWPYNQDKNSINSPLTECPGGVGCACTVNADCDNSNCTKHFRGNFCTLKEGDIFPEFKAIDQFGDEVNIYDFANQGKYILVELGATWCGPCNTLAAYFTYNEKDITSTSIWKPQYDNLYDWIHNNQIYFITVLYEDEFRDNATNYTVEEWYDNYPDDNIPILADVNKLLHGIVKPTGIPVVILLDENMNILSMTNRGFNKSFDLLIEIFNKGQ